MFKRLYQKQPLFIQKIPNIHVLILKTLAETPQYSKKGKHYSFLVNKYNTYLGQRAKKIIDLAEKKRNAAQ